MGGLPKDKAPTVRQKYHGYDCYARTTDTRIVLRLPHLAPEVPNRPDLPKELSWPIPRDWDAIRTYLDAVVYCDVARLEAIKKQFPDHDFKINGYIVKIKVAGIVKEKPNLRDLDEADLMELADLKESRRKTLWSGTLDQLDFQFDGVVWRHTNPSTSLGSHPVRPEQTLELILSMPNVSGPPTVFTKVSIKKNGTHIVLEHHKGYYKAQELDPDLYKTILRLRPRKRRETALDRPETAPASPTLAPAPPTG